MSFWTKKNQIGKKQDNDSLESTSTSEKGPENSASPSTETNKEPQNNPQAASSLSSQDQNFSKVRSALSAGTVIQGKLSFDTPVRIDGKLSGEVYSSKVLIVGETAQINANIEASSLVIMGKLKGTIKASEKVQLCSGSDVEASIVSPSLIIESGARFNGTSDMYTSSKKSETRVISEEKVDLEEMIDTSAKNKGSKNDSSVVSAGLN